MFMRFTLVKENEKSERHYCNIVHKRCPNDKAREWRITILLKPHNPLWDYFKLFKSGKTLLQLFNNAANGQL